jgi:regulator of extracellular matrix RemA (YlzA/DUF370 family)
MYDGAHPIHLIVHSSLSDLVIDADFGRQPPIRALVVDSEGHIVLSHLRDTALARDCEGRLPVIGTIYESAHEISTITR